MNYLVTGGAGFIGSHVVEALLDRGDGVTVVDNMSTGELSNLDRVRDRIEVVHGSVLDPVLVDELVEAVDVVVHLAAVVGVRLVLEKPLHSFVTNIRGAENVLEAAHRYRKKVLLTSSSEIYGKSQERPFKEDGNRVLGSNKVSRWGYAISKAVDEILAFGYHRERGLPTIVVRLFNTVGPRQSGAYGMVLPSFVEKALSGEPLTVYGDGTQTRCFCHVSDVIRALLLLMEEPIAEGDVFNVGSTEEISMLDLAERVVKVTGSSSEIETISYEQAYESGFEDMNRRVPDISRINNLTGWEPSITLDEIIEDIVGDRSSARESLRVKK